MANLLSLWMGTIMTPTRSALDQVDGDPVFVAMRKCCWRGRKSNPKRNRLKQTQYITATF